MHKHLSEFGFVVLEGLVDASRLSALRQRVEELFQQEGDRAGSEFKQERGSRRLANLVNKGEVFRQIVLDTTVLSCVRQVIGEEYKLSSLNARSVDPHAQTPQPLHCDMAALPDDAGYWVCNAVWMLDDFTEDNGPLRVVPGSHRWGRLPQDEMEDATEPHPQEILVTGRAGTVVVTNSHLWHGGTGNRTDRSRTAVHAFYCRRDKPQQQYQKGLLDAQLLSELTPELKHLLAVDDPLNDQLSSTDGPRSGFL
jgi:ectoine hydroxylase-related dioxygenase (phytanoyl-CoA dioxygenase family)